MSSARTSVTGRSAGPAEAAAREIAEATGRQALGVACHMGDWDRIEALVERVYERFGRLDVLVNNAGINPGMMPVSAVTSEYFDKLYAVNVKGPLRLAALAAPRMGRAGGAAHGPSRRRQHRERHHGGRLRRRAGRRRLHLG